MCAHRSLARPGPVAIREAGRGCASQDAGGSLTVLTWRFIRCCFPLGLGPCSCLGWGCSSLCLCCCCCWRRISITAVCCCCCCLLGALAGTASAKGTRNSEGEHLCWTWSCLAVQAKCPPGCLGALAGSGLGGSCRGAIGCWLVTILCGSTQGLPASAVWSWGECEEFCGPGRPSYCCTVRPLPVYLLGVGLDSPALGLAPAAAALPMLATTQLQEDTKEDI